MAKAWLVWMKTEKAFTFIQFIYIKTKKDHYQLRKGSRNKKMLGTTIPRIILCIQN